MAEEKRISVKADTPKMVFCQKCSQIMSPSVDNGRMVYVCESDQHRGQIEMESAADDNICVYRVCIEAVLHLLFLRFDNGAKTVLESCAYVYV